MTIDDILRLVAHDEHRTLELKKSTGELKEAMHTACAFLNTEGGWLLFGVAPQSLKVLGQEVTDNTRRELAQALAGLEPAVDVRPEYVDVPERPGCQVIAMRFDPFVWGRDPYTYHGCPYLRVESTTQRMSRSLYDERLRAAKPQFYAWERQKAEGMTLEDISEHHVRGAVHLGVVRGRMSPSAELEPCRQLLAKMKLVTSEGEPNNAAALLFGTQANEYPQFALRMARFVGNSKMQFRDNMVAEGNFFDLLDAGVSFFFKHLSLSGQVVGFTRQEQLEIPAEALREALTNALCHRQWERYNQTVSIAIFDDRVEIANPGALPPQLPLEKLKQPHESYPYNPIIASVLYQSTYLEKWGTGIGRILEVCLLAGVPEPRWSYEGGMLTVTFPRPKLEECLSKRSRNKKDSKKSVRVECLSNEECQSNGVSECQSKSPQNEKDNKNGVQVECESVRVSKYASVRVECQSKQAQNEEDDDFKIRERKAFDNIIVEYCIIPRSSREILSHLSISYHSRNINKYIQPLLESGCLAMTQPDKPHSPTQRYVAVRK